MGALALSFAGAALGGNLITGTILGMTGAQIGWMVGSALGGSLFNQQKDQHLSAPRLESGQFVGVPYGEFIPYSDGSTRLAGNVLWISEFRSIPHTTTQESGKGGGSSTDYTTYTYEIDLLFAIAHHRDEPNPIGIRKMWYNNKLLYNIGDDASENTLRSSHYSKDWTRLTFYDGNSSQLPDPDYEVAVTDAPAYRGLSTVFIKNFKLGQNPNVGNFQFELVRQASISFVPINIYTPSQIYIAMDVSGSMVGTKLANLKTAMNLFCDELQIVANNNTVHRIMLVAWSSSVVSYGEYTSNTDGIAAMRVFIDGLVISGGTSAVAAVQNAHIFFAETPNQNNIFVIISDGAMSDVSTALTNPLYKIQDMLDTTTGSYSEANGNSVYMRGIGINTAGSLSNFDNSGLPIPVITDANPQELANEIIEAVKVKVKVLAVNEQTPSDCIARICDYSNITNAMYDTTALSAITKGIIGFHSGGITSGRALIEQLMQSHNFGAYCADKIYFYPLASSPVRTFTFEELGADFDKSQDEPFALQQTTNIEQGAKYNVTYPCVTNNYNTDTRTTDRTISVVNHTVQAIDLPVAMTPEQAQGVADTLALMSQSGRYSAEISVFGEHDDLTVGDVITVPDRSGRQYRMRIGKVSHSWPVVKLSLLMDDSKAIRETGITEDTFNVDNSLTPLGETEIELLDIPLLADSLETTGIGYGIAAYGTTSNWGGCTVLQSHNDTTYSVIDTIGEVAVVGITTTVLQAGVDNNALDTTSHVTVSVNKAASGSTYADILNDRTVGLWLIGSELVQVINVELVTTGIYKLHGMLRGRLGTEWAMSTHQIGERVVKLQSDGIRSADVPVSKLDQVMYYKGVTYGQNEADVTGETFTNTGVCKKPLSPVHAVASKSGSDIVLTWQRRTRLESRLVGGLYFPLGEDSEAYEIDVYDGVDVVRTITSTTPTLTYTSAQQTTDFGSTVNSVHVKIYQMSAVRGRGYALDYQSGVL